MFGKRTRASLCTRTGSDRTDAVVGKIVYDAVTNVTNGPVLRGIGSFVRRVREAVSVKSSP